MNGRDAFPRSAVLRAELVRHADHYTATLELPDGSHEDLAAASETDVRADVLAAARQFLTQQGHQFGRLTVLDAERLWELVLPADETQAPVLLDDKVRDQSQAARDDSRGTPPLEQAQMTDAFPAEPTLAATITRTDWGQYEATLTLPDGSEQAFTDANLDSVRARVLADARSYLATQIGHPGRLDVTDPDGTWLLGIPNDGGEPVAIASMRAADAHAATTRSSAPAAPTVPLPARPATPAPHHRTRPRARSYRLASVSDRRLPLLAVLAAVILGVVLVQALNHGGPAGTAAKLTQTAKQEPAGDAHSQPAAVHQPKPAPQPKPTASRKPAPAPKLKPATKPTAVKPKPTPKPVPKTHVTPPAPTTPRTVHRIKRRKPTPGAAHRSTASEPPSTRSSSPPPVTSTPSAPIVTSTPQTPPPPPPSPATPEPSRAPKPAPLPSPSGPPPL